MTNLFEFGGIFYYSQIYRKMSKNNYRFIAQNCSKDKTLSYIKDLSDIEAIVVDEIED